MSFSIKQIKAILSEHNMPVEDLDKATEEICARHSADLDSIKEERDSYKKDAETLATVQKELETLKAATGDGKNPYKVKYEAIKEEFEAYKKDVDSKAVRAEKEKAYTELLKEAGVSEKRINSVLKVSDVDSIELDDAGKIKDAGNLKKKIEEEWSDFIPSLSQKGANTSTPPNNTGGNTMTKEEIRKISDPIARQKAMAENPSLFGLQ